MTDRLETTIAEHQAIYDAIAARDADAAERAVVNHLAISKTWILKATTQQNGQRVASGDP
jgi:DNA-binding FadR family transcriptional regulator